MDVVYYIHDRFIIDLRSYEIPEPEGKNLAEARSESEEKQIGIFCFLSRACGFGNGIWKLSFLESCRYGDGYISQ